MAAAVFNTAHNVGDTGFIFTDLGAKASVAITALDFREGFNPLSFDANLDIIYTTSTLSTDGVTYITRPQGLFFATLQEMVAYVNS